MKEKRKLRTEIQSDEVVTLQEAEAELKIAKDLWAEVIEKGKELREKELLDFHHQVLIDDGGKVSKKKKKIIAGIKNKMRKNHTFHYLSRHIGKGMRDNIKRLQTNNENNNNIKTIINREEIEARIKEHNAAHFKTAHDSIAFKDRTCNKLRIDSIREKMLKGTLQRNECDDKRVHSFLRLLKQNDRNEHSQQRRDMIDQDWIKVVKKS